MAAGLGRTNTPSGHTSEWFGNVSLYELGSSLEERFEINPRCAANRLNQGAEEV